MVVNADTDAGMLGLEPLEDREHENMKRNFADGNGYTAALEETVGIDLVFSFFDLLVCGFDMRE